ncbi:MAG TPA: DUF4394 domain-containing protein [Roseococcus sp.]|nr:DUF4394 domain-containing protein [Roseococcus sp.]
MTRILAAAVLATASLAGAAQANTVIGLTADNQLVRMDSETRRASAPVRVTGAEGRLVGIDQRPANGMLYGLTDAGQIVTIDPATGRATQASRLSEAFPSGGRAVVDFNPVADRLRVMGVSGTSLRINVDTGQTIVDGSLKYAPGELAGTTPRITAGAYTNAMPGATATMLLTLDTMLGMLNVQNPPNEGVQAPRGRLSVSVPATAAFDILSNGPDANRAYVLAGGALHMLDLASGALSAPMPVANLPAAGIIDIAVMR